MEDLVEGRGVAGRRTGSSDPPFVARFDAGGVEPRIDFVDIEAEQTTPFVERDASLAHQSSHVAYGDSEMLGEVVD